MTQKAAPEPRRGPASLEDVARHAGVNKYTVSAVPNSFKSNTRLRENTSAHSSKYREFPSRQEDLTRVLTLP